MQLIMKKVELRYYLLFKAKTKYGQVFVFLPQQT